MTHAFPFRLVDRPGPGEPGASDDPPGRGCRILLTQGAALLRGRGDYPVLLAVEALAQACLAISQEGAPEGSSPEGSPPESAVGGVRLAGLDRVIFADELESAPLRAGDLLEAEAETVGTFGSLRKVEGRLRRDGRTVVEAVLLLAAVEG